MCLKYNGEVSLGMNQEDGRLPRLTGVLLMDSRLDGPRLLDAAGVAGGLHLAVWESNAVKVPSGLHHHALLVYLYYKDTVNLQFSLPTKKTGPDSPWNTSPLGV